MARPKGKPSQDGKPGVEELRLTIGADRPKSPRPEFIAAAIAGVVGHSITMHPSIQSTDVMITNMHTAFDLAEAAEIAHQERYGT